MPEAPGAAQTPRIETFRSRSCWDLQAAWLGQQPDGALGQAQGHPWGAAHRPDWQARGLIIWPRGGQWHYLRLALPCPEPWQALRAEGRLLPCGGGIVARLTLRWWADQAELWVDGQRVHAGDLFDTSCRWRLPESWWQGQPLALELRLRSPLHDDGALISSAVVLEPAEPSDPLDLLAATKDSIAALRREAGGGQGALPLAGGRVHVLGHAHLDLAWLWPVADTWQAAERTFASALDLMERFEELHFAHSTPALYAWLEQNRPTLFDRLQMAVAAGRFEPINGPWVESDCVLISTNSLLRQFQLGQHYSQRTFPALEHRLAWLPDSFGFGAGLPAVAQATGVDWFCTHKLFWNATNPFPHRLFRWRSRCGAELRALMTAPIGTDGDPVAIERYWLEWQAATGSPEALWLPGVGDHGGGPTAEMLEQLQLWQQQSLTTPRCHGSLRAYLAKLEPLAASLPVWRDELYLELHRGCATSRPDQKRHNRTLERLLRQAELARALAGFGGGVDWRPLLFQQFHDILPGTSIPEVFEQAEPQWRQARRQACRQRDQALHQWLGAGQRLEAGTPWWVCQLQPLAGRAQVVRLPRGLWQAEGQTLPQQPASCGGVWVQLPRLEGVVALPLQRHANLAPEPMPIANPVVCEQLPQGFGDPERWLLGNGLLQVEIGPEGIEQLWDRAGLPQLSGPLAWQRYRDAGEFWDAWDLAANYGDHPLPWQWQEPLQWLEQGPLCSRFVRRGQCGTSAVRLEGQLRAGCPWLELVLSVDWRARHELLRLELPLQQAAQRWAADTTGGILERPAQPVTPREQARWEVPAIRWLASVHADGGLAVLLDGPQGVSATPERLGVSLLRAPTWPDPGADNGWQRLRLALMPCPQGWQPAQVPQEASRFREPLWIRPAHQEPDLRPDQASQAWLGRRQVLPALGEGLELIALRAASTPGDWLMAVQNSSPLRRRCCLGDGWQLVAELDGLDRPIKPADGAAPALQDHGPEAGCELALKPWQLRFCQLRPNRGGPGSPA